MKTYTVFGRPSCPWCDKAVERLMKAGVRWLYMDLTKHPTVREELIAKGHKTVPVIYHGGHLVGGFEDLVAYLDGGALG